MDEITKKDFDSFRSLIDSVAKLAQIVRALLDTIRREKSYGPDTVAKRLASHDSELESVLNKIREIKYR